MSRPNRATPFLILPLGLVPLLLATLLTAQDQLPSNPMAGRIVFEEKGCIGCHAINGHGGDEGPDLGRDRFFGNFYDLSSRLWNHAPAMEIKAGRQEAGWPTLSTKEVDELIAFLFYLRYLGEPGNVSQGRKLLGEKGCLKCHRIDAEGEADGIPLDRLKSYASPLYVAQVIWNHGPKMQAKMEALGISSPRLEDESITHISAYLREFSRGTSSQRRYMSPGNPQAGKAVFREKGCVVCHGVRNGAPPEVPLEQTDLHRSVTAIAGTMWNHSALMMEAMAERDIPWPAFEGSQMADLIAYLYFFDYPGQAGDPQRGATVFEAKGCVRCHDSRANVIAGTDYPLATPADLIRTMWNHVPNMRELVVSRNIDWPRLSPAELRDLYAYLLGE